MDVWVSLDSPCTHRWVHMYMCRPICVSLLQPPSSLSGRTFMCSLLSANVYLLCILGSLLCLGVLRSQCYTRPLLDCRVLEGFGIYMIGILDSSFGVWNFLR